METTSPYQMRAEEINNSSLLLPIGIIDAADDPELTSEPLTHTQQM